MLIPNVHCFPPTAMGEFSAHVLHILGRAAAEQGGVISGDNPTKWSQTDPIRLWIIQLVIIIAMTQFLALFLSRIRQPRVIAEVIGGVILGPSVLGNKFRQRIFPLESIPSLTLTANIGLVLFLFLVALEIDVRLLRRNVPAVSTNLIYRRPLIRGS
ncbi:hypothetical protein D9619_000338 [Psilocybe cf. subviscida]|uniref:Cation/H+ exchanger transmembrane domain-containing protein n=1 Tax=Psilocybe cf. subviscida TaxID=2480587 RepID=A0A8H5F321_9AGAR|nr:hypothetical protein D9619_000338 [Psilocybe cf. subviscida]